VKEAPQVVTREHEGSTWQEVRHGSRALRYYDTDQGYFVTAENGAYWPGYEDDCTPEDWEEWWTLIDWLMEG
jgi:hypothetical protein